VVPNQVLEASAHEKERDDHDLYGDAGKARGDAGKDVSDRFSLQADGWSQQSDCQAQCDSTRGHGKKERPQWRESPVMMGNPGDQTVDGQLNDHGWQDGDRRHARQKRAEHGGGDTEESSCNGAQQQPPSRTA